MASDGPRNPSRNDSRPGIILSALPVPAYGPSSSMFAPRRRAWSKQVTPTKTPVAEPYSEVGAIPACSSACHAVSSSSRCCGSIARASRGEMPKNVASNVSIVGKKPPRRTRLVPRCAGAVAGDSSTVQRARGTSHVPSVALSSSVQYADGESAPPGNRQPNPMIAIGSTVSVPTRARSATSSSRCRTISSSARRSRASVLTRRPHGNRAPGAGASRCRRRPWLVETR